MNEEKNGQNAQGGGDTLDRWIEQNLHIDNPAQVQKPAQEPQQQAQGQGTQPATSHGQSASTQVTGNQPVNSTQSQAHKPHANHGPKVIHPKKPFQRQVRPRHMNKPQVRTMVHSQKPTHQPHHGAPNQPSSSNPVSGQEIVSVVTNEKKRRNFFDIFKKDRSNQTATHNKSAHPGSQHWRGKLRIIPIGGLNEVGKNCMVLEYENDIILIDVGFQFPEEDMLGVDYVIPDLSYLDDKLDRIRGILITHGHLDHIGAIPYVMQKLNFPPIYATKLTIGLIDKRNEEFGLQDKVQTRVVTADDTLQLGQFNISFFRVNHSIPDAVGIVVKSPAGNIVHTGDFKFDFSPSGGQQPADFARIAGLANQDIAALFIDSTNALKPGYTISEKKIGDSLETIIKNYEGRIVIASFSSQIGRLQQIIDAAQKYDRKIFLSGRSLIDNVYIASKLGYLKVPDGLIHDIRRVQKVPEQKALILTTGSQGESVSSLTRMAMENHQSIKIKKGDTVVLSSSPVPGNERAVFSVTNNLCRLGARIINNQIMDVHASGHAQQEDLKLMMSLVKPKYVVPVHGEYYMRYGCKELAHSLGYAEKNGVMIENGDVLEIQNNEVKTTQEKAENKYILVDGLGVGDVGTQVMMDRQTLAENGVVILIIPINPATQKMKGDIDVISRGFIYMKESEEIINEMKSIARKAFDRVIEKRKDPKRQDIKRYIKESVDKFVHEKLERHPLVLPILMEV